MKTNKNAVILIPAYNPDEKLVKLVKDLIGAAFTDIIIVNDGSKEECVNILDDVSQYKQCTILTHAVNLGKGRALKTGFNYFLNEYKNSVGLVTVDSDGQHSISDTIRVAEKLKESNNSLILGSRDFSAENIPFRSRFGNITTRRVLSFVCGIKISDTQTGLRGIPYKFLQQLMNVNGERFEYEMNMLLECKKREVKIEEVSIETIYIEDNKSSHFNPLVDSIKIYSVFLKFISSSIASFVVDIGLFSILSKLLASALPQFFILYSTIGARIVSSLINYAINKNAVFNSKARNTMTKYYTLSVFQMLASALGVSIIYKLIGTGEVPIKILVDTLLFILSFKIQREWVFKK